MMSLQFDIEYTGIAANPPRGWKGVKREAYREAGRWWHTKFKFRHFNKRWGKAYGYQPRTREYNRRKRKEKGHTEPLVWSGDTKREAMSKQRVISKRGGWAQIIINARGLNRRRNASAPNLRQEMETVLPVEIHEMARRMERKANRDIKQNARTQRRRKTIRG